MTTVSVVECVSPVSLRSCGSSVGTLLKNRRKLQKPGYRHSNDDLLDAGLQCTLVSSPIPSPIPRVTASLYGGRTITHDVIKSPSDCSDELYGDGLEILHTENSRTPGLYVVGSRPRLQGMWDMQDNASVTTFKERQSLMQNVDDLLDPTEDERVTCYSPDNPPPSPINFRPSIERFVIGGQKIARPEQCQSTPSTQNRDFNPGFVKHAQPHCVKCEGRVIEEELSQITLQRRLSSILSRHSSMHQCSEDTQNHDKEHCNTPSQLVAHDMSQLVIDLNNERSFYETYTEKKKVKEEKEQQMKEQRERRKAEKITINIKKTTRKLKRKEEKSKTVLKKSSSVRSRTSKQKGSRQYPPKECDINAELLDRYGGEGIQLPLIHTPPHHSDRSEKRDTSKFGFLSLTNQDKMVDTPVAKGQSCPNIRRYSRHDWNEECEDQSNIEADPENKLANYTKREHDVEKGSTNALKREALECVGNSPRGKPSSNQQSNETCETATIEQSPQTEEVCVGEQRKVHTKDEPEVRPLEDLLVCNTEELCQRPKTSRIEPTVSSTLIVPEKDTQCTQWISFNGDNEPILNTSPEVDDSCDTFLKRLQRAKVCKQNEATLPSGQQFCFEAMVDKRYNRWKRRRRKKQSDSRRTQVIQGSESSDENDERNSAMERIIDRMYEEINGPAPQTPNGSRDTPRTRNRRRRKQAQNVTKTPENDVNEQESSITLYDASSEGTSDGCVQSSSSLRQFSRVPDETPIFKPVVHTSQNRLSSTTPEDLCSWPYLDQYKSEILKRLKDTPPDQIEDLDRNDWLPEIKDTHYADAPYDNPDISIPDRANDDITKENRVNTPNEEGHDEIDRLPNEQGIYSTEVGDETLDIANIAKRESETETTTNTYESHIRVTESPCHSPENKDSKDSSLREVRIRTCQFDPSDQVYSYTKWTRSQKSVVKKLCSLEQRPRLSSRMGTSSLSEVGCTQEEKHTIESFRDHSMEADKLQYHPIKNQQLFQSKGETLIKRGNKVALNIKKQNVNLPSLTKNASNQTFQDLGYKRQSEKRDNTVKVKSKVPKDVGDRPRKQSIPYETSPKLSVKEGQTGVIYKENYLRSLYGYKTRINSHVNTKQDKSLRKTLTVDNLETLATKSRGKTDISKPSDLAFTRSFTFSMFDLPEVYKLYNTTLERKAAGEAR